MGDVIFAAGVIVVTVVNASMPNVLPPFDGSPVERLACTLIQEREGTWSSKVRVQRIIK